MSLEFAATVGDRGFDVRLSVAAGETVAVLGPNGAGKSTLLSVLAGLLKPDAGHARLHGRSLFEIVDGRGPWVQPHSRGISLLAQDAMLFPHLSVLDNVAFGPRSLGVARHEANSRAHAWLERVDAVELAGRRPSQLSGGQAQRIAVARALASEPGLLLLDEPLAALDVSVAPAIRRMLTDVLRDRAAIIVTHDVLDAYTLADRVVVMEAGRIVDVGPTRQVLDNPSNQFAAALVALNLLVGTSAAHGIDTDSGHRVRADSTEPIAVGVRTGVAIRPTDVDISTVEPADTGLNVVPGTVIDVEPRGDIVRVRIADLAADVPPSVVARLDLVAGTPVWFTFRPSDAVAYPV